jgi:hypothetical protein
MAAGAVAAGSLSTGGAVALPVVDARLGTTNVTPAATWNASEYDGTAFTTNQPDLNDLPKVHAVYMHASDAPSRFGELAAYFQAENRRANTLLTPGTGMAIRWDERVATDGSRRLLQDITVVKAAATSKALSSKKQFGLVGTALADAGLNDPNTKYMVYVDANSTTCGQSQGPSDTQRSAANAANGTSYSTAYAGNDPAVGGGFCNPILHELTHAFGGVLSAAPHYVRGAHCNDDGNDVMCDASNSTLPFSVDRPRTYDGSGTAGGEGNDTYLDPAADLANIGTVRETSKLGYWAVNLSRFMCPRSVKDATRPNCSVANDPTY